MAKPTSYNTTDRFKMSNKPVKWDENMQSEKYRNQLIYKIEKSIPQVVQKVLEEVGFIEWDPEVHGEDQWNILWKNQRPSLGEFRRAAAYQKLIHIPKTGLICTKDNLARLIRKMKQLYGKMFDFTPLTFILPNEYKQFIKNFNQEGNEGSLWICKPSDLSRG